VIAISKPDYIVFPDAGAADRYHDSGTAHIPKVICDKVRDQLTGAITGHKILSGTPEITRYGVNFLIVDDLCDGGATFISVAGMLHKMSTFITVDLCVSHGLFSKTREHLLANGISSIFTTDSLTKNEDGYKV
jgi:ribose-phosphate pyrophosphokinase